MHALLIALLTMLALASGRAPSVSSQQAFSSGQRGDSQPIIVSGTSQQTALLAPSRQAKRGAGSFQSPAVIPTAPQSRWLLGLCGHVTAHDADAQFAIPLHVHGPRAPPV